ncbi:MAG: Ig domain-containing protein [Clostridiaceae bacterium]|nr:Ig domain-containing protein [Clostridiaceae bacterium]
MVYYFKVEADKTPVLGEYWIPDCAAELSHVRDNVYKVEFTFNGVSLDPGEVLPNTSGYVFGLYYSDWSQWDKSNDVSNTQSYNFVESNMVPVYNSSGVLVHGIDFFNNPQFYSLSAISHGIPYDALSYTIDYYISDLNPFPEPGTTISWEVLSSVFEEVSQSYPSLNFDTTQENTNSLQPIFADYPGLTQAEVISHLPDIIAHYSAAQRFEIVNKIGENLQTTGLAKASSSGSDVNQEEFWYLMGNLRCISCTKDAVDYARSQVEVKYPGVGDFRNQVDGFRHALWNAMIVVKCNEKFDNVADAVSYAKGMTDAHERGAPTPDPAYYADKEMDLHNNRIGLEYIKSEAGTRTFKNYWFFGWHYKTVVTTPSEEDVSSSIFQKAGIGREFDDLTQFSCLSDYIIWPGVFTGCPSSGPIGNISYTAHIERRGWMNNWVSDGQTAGTTNEKRRLEAIKIKIENGPVGMGVKYQAHVERDGWQDWVQDGQVAGTTGDRKRMEAIKIELTGAPSGYGVTYQVYVMNKGWLGWKSNGEMAGTTGEQRRIEAIKIKLIKP